MSTPEVVKLLPRNATALRKTQDSTRAPRLVAGNSVATRLESGVGNCFPGLECDLRNLERRFFQHQYFLGAVLPCRDTRCQRHIAAPTTITS